MSGVISPAPDVHKPPKIALLAPYNDSVEVSSTRKFHPAFLRAIKANSGSASPKEQRDRKNPKLIWRYRLIINQSSRYCIALLQLYKQLDPKLSLYRFHAAFDAIQIYDGWTYEEVADVLRNLVHLKFRRVSDDLYEYEGSAYSTQVKLRKSRPYRNTCFYNTRHSKITGEENAIHLEIRLERKRSVQDAGIYDPMDILAIKPIEFFAKFVIVKDHRNVLEKMAQHGIELTCEQYPKLDRGYVEKYARAVNRKIGLHHISIFAAQETKQFERLQPWDCVDIEEAWNWASPDVQCDRDVGELRALLPPNRLKPKIQRERL